MCFIASSMESKNCLTTNSKDFLSRDVEDLVLEIKENLRLGGLKSRPAYAAHNRASRPSPYRIPSRSRSWGEGACEDCLKATTRHCGGHSCLTINNKNLKSKSNVTADDPYEMLQELLRDGSLIKEAVRRLEMRLSPKHRYFYDSDEESRTPLLVCNVDL
ncbi:hypothetical protein RUM43_004135 [Polyplax serrata]|uniref:Uncharacterized protein n=1 Tax=Polyplax serrata TaxID=468196 RepID=A0AAN8SAK2_POLSC